MRITFYTIFSLAFLASASSAVGHVLLKYPSGDETFSTGDTIKIEWQVAIDHGDCNWDLYFSTDGGSSWSEIAIDLSKSNFSYEWIIPGNATSSGKIKVVQDNVIGSNYESESRNFTINNLPTYIASEENQIKNFVIYPAYPNPFNSSTVISFNLPEQNHVKLIVFNVAGEEVETIVNSEMSAGFHKISWNADNASSGVYFYAIETKYSLQTRKVILLK